MIELLPREYDAGPAPSTNGMALLSNEPDDRNFVGSCRTKIIRWRSKEHKVDRSMDKWVVWDGWEYGSFFSKTTHDFVDSHHENLNADFFFNSPEEAFADYMKHRDNIARANSPLGYWHFENGKWERKKWETSSD